MRGLARYEGVALDRIRLATRDAFVELIDRTVDARPNFVIIAGDLYDGDWTDFNTGLFFVGQMSKLRQHGIRAYVLYGNHDAHSQLTRKLGLPENVSEFDHRSVETHVIEKLDVALHGRSYPKREVRENLCTAYPSPKQDMFNIGVLHTGLGGLGGHANYAPCALDELINKGYDYWALGHVHTRQVLNERPHIVFPGNLQGRHINEEGSRSASLVTVEHGQVTQMEEWECDVVRWYKLTVPVDNCETYDQISAAVGEKLSNLLATNDRNRVCAVRVQLTGDTPMHGKLLASTDVLTAEIRASSLDVGGEAVWIEKVEVLTNPLRTDLKELATHETLADLQALLGGSLEDPELLQRIEQEFSILASKLPIEFKSDMESNEDSYSQLILDSKNSDLLTRVLERVTYEISIEERDAS